MNDGDDPQLPIPLVYQDPETPTAPWARTPTAETVWVALPLCLPGLAAWLDFFAIQLLQRLEADRRTNSPLLDGLAGWLWPLFWIAVLTGFVSVVLYGPPRRVTRPGIVVFNLLVHVTGLLFGAACFLAAATGAAGAS